MQIYLAFFTTAAAALNIVCQTNMYFNVGSSLRRIYAIFVGRHFFH